jgi:PncC family amidohydrolase
MPDIPENLIGAHFRQRGWKLAVAESCTGGLISHRITNAAGSSDYFLGGVTAYSYEAKELLLGIAHETILRLGAVSQETVVEMATGVRSALGADVAISASGIAGPGGGLPNKPVGTVWIGVCVPDGIWAKRFLFSGDRSEVKASTAEESLQALLRYFAEGHPWQNGQVL